MFPGAHPVFHTDTVSNSLFTAIGSVVNAFCSALAPAALCTAATVARLELVLPMFATHALFDSGAMPGLSSQSDPPSPRNTGYTAPDDFPPTPQLVKDRIDFLAKLYLENGDIVEAARTAQVLRTRTVVAKNRSVTKKLFGRTLRTLATCMTL